MREINMPKGKSEIWIADDIMISSKTRYSRFHKFWASILLGWTIIDVK